MPHVSHRRPPGPDQPFAFDADARTLEYIGAQLAVHGGIFRVPGPPGRPDVWVLNDPRAVHHVLTRRQTSYDKGSGFERVKMLLGDGLIVSDGAHWRRRRQMLQPAFSRPSIEALSLAVRRCIEAREPQWEHAAETGEPLDVCDEANRLALSVILCAVFGESLASVSDAEGRTPFDLLVDDTARDLGFAMRFRRLWPVVRRLVAERRASPAAGADFMSRYLAAADRETGAALDDEAVVDELMTLIVAGHETSAATIAWAWSLLAEHEAAQDELRAEAVAHAGRPAGAPARPEWAARIVHETLRLYPPVWMFSRRARVDDEIEGYDVPAGTQLLITPYFLHRLPACWDEPERFDPRRFDAAGGCRERGAYLPFSAGPRRCAGDDFALVEAVEQLTWTAARYRVRRADDAPIVLDPGVNLRSKHPIRLRVERAPR